MKTTYISAILGLASSEGSDNEFIRKHDNGYMPTKFKGIPDGSISPNDKDFTCNKNSVASANVFKVKAGDEIGMKQAFGGTRMQHPGPIQVYAAAVDDAKTASPADLDWYKIHQALICKAGNAESLRSTAWCSWDEDSVHFKIPSTLPDGQYLIRGEHIALHGAHGGEAEFYYACVQIEVSGNSASSIPGDSVKIPGVYKQDDPAVNFSLWGPSTAYDFTPGPDVIPGGTIRGSADGASGDVEKTVEGGASAGSAPATEAAINQPQTQPQTQPQEQPQTQPDYSQGNNGGGCDSTYTRRHARDITRRV